jgi:hypothetical protein
MPFWVFIVHRKDELGNPRQERKVFKDYDGGNILKENAGLQK